MNFQEAEKAYQDLRAQFSTGKLSNSDFESEVSKLKVQDAEGRWWQIGVQSGEWYVHDGQKWSKANPPIPGGAAVQPSAPPEGPGAGAAAMGAAGPAPKPPSTSSVKPRLFSAAPAGREGGLPTPVLIGIIAVVAIVGIAILVAAYMALSGQNQGAAVTNATRTPLSVGLGQPTAALPTLPPPPPTNTAIPLPTIALTPTAAVTPTATAVVKAVTGTVAVKATAVRKVAASPTPPPPVVKATAAPNLKPGVYVSKVRADPPQPNPGDAITFYVTFFNNSGQLGPTPWLVKIFKCEAACTPDELAVNKSIGETVRSSKPIVAGTTELGTEAWPIGLGACNLVASPYYIDPVSGQVLPFPTTAGGDRLYFNIKTCR